jgi:hypothetical protein
MNKDLGSLMELANALSSFVDGLTADEPKATQTGVLAETRRAREAHLKLSQGLNLETKEAAKLTLPELVDQVLSAWKADVDGRRRVLRERDDEVAILRGKLDAARRNAEDARRASCGHGSLVQDAVEARRLLRELTHHHEWVRGQEPDLTELAQVAQRMYDAQKRKVLTVQQAFDEHRARPTKSRVTRSQLELLTHTIYAQIWNTVNDETRESLYQITERILTDLGIEATS